jgi:O-antigen ligase
MKIINKLVLSIPIWVLLVSPLFMFMYPRTNKVDWIEFINPLLVYSLILMVAFLISRIKGVSQVKTPVSLLLFIVFTVAAYFFSDVRAFGFGEVLMSMIGGLTFLFFAVDENKQKLEKYLPAVLTGILLISAAVGMKAFWTTDHLRFFGFFFDPSIKANAWPNAYATFFLLTAPFVMFFFWKLPGKFSYISTILAGLLLSTFFLTYSRAGLIALIIQAAIALVLFRRSIRFSNTGVKIFLTFIFSAFLSFYAIDAVKSINWVTVDLKERITFTETLGGTSVNERAEFFAGSVELIKQKPFFGWGPMSFKWVYPQFQGGFLAISDHPHNIFLKIATERGLLAMLSFIVFMAIVFVKNNPFSSKSDLITKIGWLGIMGAFIHSMVDYNFNFFSVEIVFWFILALLSRLKETRTNFFAVMLIVAILLSGLIIKLETRQFYRIIDAPTDEKIREFNPLMPLWSFHKINDVFESELALNKQLDVNAYDTRALGGLARYEKDKGNYSNAISIYEKIIKIDPKNTFEHYLEYAKLLKDQNQTEKLRQLSTLVRPLMEEYKNLYKINLHYTQRTNEMNYVRQLEDVMAFEY